MGLLEGSVPSCAGCSAVLCGDQIQKVNDDHLQAVAGAPKTVCNQLEASGWIDRIPLMPSLQAEKAPGMIVPAALRLPTALWAMQS